MAAFGDNLVTVIRFDPSAQENNTQSRYVESHGCQHQRLHSVKMDTVGERFWPQTGTVFSDLLLGILKLWSFEVEMGVGRSIAECF